MDTIPSDYEPEGRLFESARAHHKIKSSLQPFRFTYLATFKLLNCPHNGSCTIPACTRDRLRRQMFPHERDHRIHGLHHFRENIIEIEVVACAPNQLLFTLHPVVEFLRLFGDQGALSAEEAPPALESEVLFNLDFVCLAGSAQRVRTRRFTLQQYLHFSHAVVETLESQQTFPVRA